MYGRGNYGGCSGAITKLTHFTDPAKLKVEQLERNLITKEAMVADTTNRAVIAEIKVLKR